LYNAIFKKNHLIDLDFSQKEKYYAAHNYYAPHSTIYLILNVLSPKGDKYLRQGTIMRAINDFTTILSP
jgi:hypothetical protein